MNRFERIVSAALILTVAPRSVAQGDSPDQAVRRASVADGFEVQLVASEPLVRQPVCIEFDDRGRLWVIQYLQYPNPEGLKRVLVDRYSRTRYDRVPDPPPRGPRGADRVTILADDDGDGRMDRGRDFVEGLNLASGIAFGHGGVFILNVPYLLFYPDRDRDDVPDADPEVLLAGFGMEDAHSVANSLTWGPDGWLYGCQGSTVTANIRGVEFQQGVWRYHPVTRAFELFCEGGGNSWGLDFDRAGNLLYSTNWGGHVLLHGVQGAYLVKSFAKHGALHNPFAFGHFDHAPHDDFQGGHVTVGGILYQGDSFPKAFHGKYIAGDLLGHAVRWHHVAPWGSSFRTANGGVLLDPNDSWFASSDVTLGPEGAVYVADWHDARTAHPDPDAQWDRRNGRIYRIAAKGTPTAGQLDVATLSTDELLSRLRHPSQFHVRRARQELVRRGALDAIPRLREQSLDPADPSLALESLWTLDGLGGFDEDLARRLLDHPYPPIRSWTVRFLGDQGSVSEPMAHRLDELAEREPDVLVRQQLACSAARLPAHHAMPIINANINRDIDNADPYLPLLWWWAVERHAVAGRDEVMRRFVRPSAWRSRLGRETLLPRLVRRYAAEGTTEGLDALVRLLHWAPLDADRKGFWSPTLAGLREAPVDTTTGPLTRAGEHELARLVKTSRQQDANDADLLRLAIALRQPDAIDQAVRTVADRRADRTLREQRLVMLADADPEPALVDVFSALLARDEPESIRLAAVGALARIDDRRVPALLMDQAPGEPSEKIRSAILQALLGRKEWALGWLEAVDRGAIRPADVPLESVRRIALHGDQGLDALVAKHWGKLEGATREEKLAEVRRLNNDLRAATGDRVAGKAIYTKQCATCHALFGEGAKLGPDLTSANRNDRDYLLVSLVDPSGVIRKEFMAVVVQTTDGRVLTGLVVARDAGGLTLADGKNQSITLPNDQIESLRESDVSLMPDDLYRQLKPQELRDLFAYLQSSPP